MLKKVIISLIGILISYIALAQDSTIEPPKTSEKNTPEIEYDFDLSETNPQPLYNKVLIIPFEARMYRSEVDRAVYKKTGMHPSQTRNNFRLGIAQTLLVEINKTRPAIVLLGNTEEMGKDLAYVYNSIGYHYKEMPLNEEKPVEPKVKQLFNKVKNKADAVLYGEPIAQKPGTRIQDGQIYSAPYKIERFMDSRAINPNLFEFLSNKYEVDYIVMINQLDVVIAPGTDQRTIQNGTYRREIKAHYTIFDQQGNEIYASAAKNYFPSIMNDMNLIVKGHFPKIAKEIAFHIPAIQLTNEGKNITNENAASQTLSGEATKPTDNTFQLTK